jgi:hypothetical protein
MSCDKFGNAAVPADYRLIKGATEWIRENRSGYFADCDRCGAALESAPAPLKFWTVRFGSRGHRRFCQDCGDFLDSLSAEASA